MTQKKLGAYFIAFGLVLLAATGYGAYDYLEQSQSPAAVFLATAAKEASIPLHLDLPTKTKNCEVHDGLPDHNCTPGAVFASATPNIICVMGYTKTVRNVSVRVKKQLYTAYGIPYPQATGSYELDHLIPLELGGSNDPANLFPEAANPTPGFHEKDLVENYLNQEVCAGNINLPFAQQQIADNWKVVYESLSSTELAELKQQYSGK